MRKRGFTLSELMIVITLITILAFLATVSFLRFRQRSKLARVSVQLADVPTALTQYAEDNNYQYPADVSRSVPPGLERYLVDGVWPKSVWPEGVFDWDNWIHPTTSQQIYQITYRLCDLDDPIASCSDPVLFPNFVRHSGIFYCISGPCLPHISYPTVPAYCVNCIVKQINY